VSSDITALIYPEFIAHFALAPRVSRKKLANILSRLAVLHLSTIELSDPTAIR
jgi:hypothetical protein